MARAYLSHDGEAHPRGHLEGVVGARHEVEQEAPRDGSLLGPLGRSHVAQHEVTDQVTCKYIVYMTVSVDEQTTAGGL